MVNPRPYEDTAQAEAQKEAKRYADQVRKDIDAFIAAASQSREGLRFLWWLLEIGKFATQPFSGNALTTSFSCGELNVGMQVFARIQEVDPEIYLKMVKEEENVRRKPANKRTDDSDGTDV